MTEGINVLGVYDESGTIPGGQIHFSYRPRGPDGAPAERAKLLPPGTRVAVSRCPCLAAADIRVLTIADPRNLPNDLLELSDLVIFSGRSERPDPCLMSGGDLDGDLYFVVWDEELVPREEDAPLDYTPAEKPEPLDRALLLSSMPHVFLFTDPCCWCSLCFLMLLVRVACGGFELALWCSPLGAQFGRQNSCN